MKLSVVIPAFNEEKLLPDCLQTLRASLKGLEERGWEWELIVCDNNSTDATAAVASDLGATVVFEPVNQIGRARNAGAAAATGDWLLFVDADSRVNSALITELAQEISTGQVIGGGACIEPFGEFSRRILLPIKIWNGISRVCRLAAGSFLFCRRDAFVAIGGFSLERFAGEELDLSQRIKRFGRPLGQRFIILKRARLETSARKAGLYSPWEVTWTLLRMTFRYRAATGSRDACFLWYDGRR